MNGTQQRQRYTAVSRVEKRLDDLELVAVEMAAEVVGYRDQSRATAAEACATCQARWEATAKAQKTIFEWQAAVDARTLWQRLRVLVRGVTR